MTETKTEWKEQTSKIGWTNVPASVNRLLEIFRYNHYYVDDPEKRRETKMKQLTDMSEESIKSGMAWLKEHRKQYTFSSKNARGYSRDKQFVRLNVPYTRYAKWGGRYRGITSTVVWNQFTIKSSEMRDYEAIVDAHWDKRASIKDEKALQEQRMQLGQIKRLVEDEEKNAKRVLSKEQILEGALETFDYYRCGCSGSSHGAWSFGLSYSTRYLASGDSFQDGYRHNEYTSSGRESPYEKGDLMDPDWPALSNKIMEMASKITDDGLRSQLPELAIRYTNAHQTMYQASKDWHEVMNDIYNKMKEMIE